MLVRASDVPESKSVPPNGYIYEQIRSVRTAATMDPRRLLQRQILGRRETTDFLSVSKFPRIGVEKRRG